MPMSKDLAAENLQLRRQLSELLEHARRNEQIMLRHQRFDLLCIGSTSFRELLEHIFTSLKESSELDIVTLCLIDKDYEIRRILVELSIHLSDFPTLLFAQHADELGELTREHQKPLLGPYSEELHGAMFPEPLPVPASVAIVPLVRNNELIGMLSLGSLNPMRFTPYMASDFIGRMTSIIAICVENVLNHERLRHIGLTDPLTGVNNRRYLERRLQEEIGRMRRHGNALSCLFIDIDHFKRINDTHGHQIGDEVLREVAARIKAELRLSDALGRFGGEEFVVLLIDAALADAQTVAERIRISIAEPKILMSNGDKLGVTASLGVATLTAPESHETLDHVAQAFIARADQALYKAKSEGRNRVVSIE
jgi:diguanylate cyclase (GGDEF)-like protein